MRPPKFVLSRCGTLKGETTGSVRCCRLEGCGGACIGVRWPKEPGQKRAKVTFPCSKGMKTVNTTTWQII